MGWLKERLLNVVEKRVARYLALSLAGFVAAKAGYVAQWGFNVEIDPTVFEGALAAGVAWLAAKVRDQAKAGGAKAP